MEFKNIMMDGADIKTKEMGFLADSISYFLFTHFLFNTT